jgi:hypothetical protein
LGNSFDEMMDIGGSGSSSSGHAPSSVVKMVTVAAALTDDEYSKCNEAWAALRKGLKAGHMLLFGQTSHDSIWLLHCVVAFRIASCFCHFARGIVLHLIVAS